MSKFLFVSTAHGDLIEREIQAFKPMNLEGQIERIDGDDILIISTKLIEALLMHDRFFTFQTHLRSDFNLLLHPFHSNRSVSF